MLRSEPWSGEPRVILWAITPRGAVIRHNFYHAPFSEAAVERAQMFEYELGLVTWLEYRGVNE